MEFENDNVVVRVNGDEIYAQDITNRYNMPTLLTRSTKWIRKAKKNIIMDFDNDRKFSTVKILMDRYGIKYRNYLDYSD